MHKRRGKRKKKISKTSDVGNTSEPLSCGNEDVNNELKNYSIEGLKLIISRVQNMTWTPSVFVQDIECEESISVVDINTNHSICVCAFENSSKIYVKIETEEKLAQIEDEDLCMSYNTLKVAKDDYENRTAHLSTDRYLTGHSLPVTGLKIVENKKLLLSSSLDGTVKAWGSEKFDYMKTYYGMEFISDIDVSSNSTYFAISSHKGKVGLFSFERSVPDMILSGHTEDVNCVRFHPNGIYFATSSYDKTIRLWCTQTGNVARTFHDDHCPGTLAFSPDGQYLATYSGGGIKIWDLASGQLLTYFTESSEESPFTNLCFSEFGGVLASGSTKELKLWNLNNIQPSSASVLAEKPASLEACLLQKHSMVNQIKLIKFDENNYFTCVTA